MWRGWKRGSKEWMCDLTCDWEQFNFCWARDACIIINSTSEWWQCAWFHMKSQDRVLSSICHNFHELLITQLLLRHQCLFSMWNLSNLAATVFFSYTNKIGLSEVKSANFSELTWGRWWGVITLLDEKLFKLEVKIFEHTSGGFNKLLTCHVQYLNTIRVIIEYWCVYISFKSQLVLRIEATAPC